jgi:hypothetical protein
VSRGTTALPTEPVQVVLTSKDELQGMRVRLPLQDARYNSEEDLPALVVVRSSDKARVEIAGTGWWGNAGMSDHLVGVEASSNLVEKMRDRGSAEPKPTVTIERARWWHVVRYARGFLVPTFIALLVAAAAIGGAIATIVTTTLAVGIVLAVVAVIALAELAKAATSIAEAAHHR